MMNQVPLLGRQTAKSFVPSPSYPPGHRMWPPPARKIGLTIPFVVARDRDFTADAPLLSALGAVRAVDDEPGAIARPPDRKVVRTVTIVPSRTQDVATAGPQNRSYHPLRSRP